MTTEEIFKLLILLVPMAGGNVTLHPMNAIKSAVIRSQLPRLMWRNS